jgi:hypothetical protein
MGVSVGGNYRSDIYRKVTTGFDALGNPISITSNGIAGKILWYFGIINRILESTLKLFKNGWANCPTIFF